MYKAIYFRSGEIDVDVPSCMKWTIRAHLRCINGFADEARFLVAVATSFNLPRGGAVHHVFEGSLLSFGFLVVPLRAVLRNVLASVARADIASDVSDARMRFSFRSAMV